MFLADEELGRVLSFGIFKIQQENKVCYFFFKCLRVRYNNIKGRLKWTEHSRYVCDWVWLGSSMAAQSEAWRRSGREKGDRRQLKTSFPPYPTKLSDSFTVVFWFRVMSLHTNGDNKVLTFWIRFVFGVQNRREEPIVDKSQS